MSHTATNPTTGTPKLLAEYDCDEGARQLIEQRIDGKIRITDRRRGGRSYLVDEGFSSNAELEALVADYLARPASSDTPRWPAGSEHRLPTDAAPRL